MKLIVFKGGDTDPQKVERCEVKAADDPEARAVVLHLANGDMAVLKLEGSGEVGGLIKLLQG